LREEQQRLEREHERLAAERERLGGENERLRAEGERLQEINERLRGEVEALRRAAKRQAAPFSKGDPAPHPKRPGRKPGVAYGTRAHRRPPEHVDQIVAVGWRGAARAAVASWSWSGWRCSTRRAGVHPPAGDRLPGPGRPLPVVRPQGAAPSPGADLRCARAAATQLGPRVVALASWLSKGLGLPAGKIARLLGHLGLQVTPGGVTQAIARAARRCQPTYQALVQGCGPAGGRRC
jgi:transposase